MKQKVLLGVVSFVLLAGEAAAQSTRTSPEEKIKELQQQMLDMQSKMQEQMSAMQREMDALKEQQKKDTEEVKKQQEENTQETQTAQEEFKEQTLEMLDRVKIGGNGSMRFES